MSENGLHKIPTMRAALVAIQELHKPVPIYTTEAGECEHGDECDPIELYEGAFCPTHTEGVTCSECAEVVQDYGVVDEFPSYPCATRRLADDALGGDNNG